MVQPAEASPGASQPRSRARSQVTAQLAAAPNPARPALSMQNGAGLESNPLYQYLVPNGTATNSSNAATGEAITTLPGEEGGLDAWPRPPAPLPRLHFTVMCPFHAPTPPRRIVRAARTVPYRTADVYNSTEGDPPPGMIWWRYNDDIDPRAYQQPEQVLGPNYST